MPTSDQGRRHSPFPLPHTTVAQEIVAIHDRQFVQEEFQRSFIPTVLRAFALGGRGERRGKN